MTCSLRAGRCPEQEQRAGIPVPQSSRSSRLSCFLLPSPPLDTELALPVFRVFGHTLPHVQLCTPHPPPPISQSAGLVGQTCSQGSKGSSSHIEVICERYQEKQARGSWRTPRLPTEPVSWFSPRHRPKGSIAPHRASGRAPGSSPSGSACPVWVLSTPASTWGFPSVQQLILICLFLFNENTPKCLKQLTSLQYCWMHLPTVP